jgi:hypothetical protein
MCTSLGIDPQAEKEENPMIIQDNDFLLSDAEFFELGQHIRPERSRLALLPGEEAQAPSRVVEEYEELPGDRRQALTAIVSGLAYPVRFMRLHYSMADESISRQLIVWPKSGDEVVTLARNGRLWRASTNTEFGVRSLIKEVLGAGSNLRREPFTLTLSSTATLVFLGILEQMHFAHLYAILMNQAPDGTFKAEDVLERMRQSSKEDFRWPLAMFEKVLPVRPFETVQLEDVTGGLAELVERELVESIDENGRLYELTPEGGLVADSVVHEVSKAALCVTQCRPDGVIGHDAVLLVRGSFYLFLFEITGEAGVLASVNEEAADVFLSRTMQAPDAEVISAAALAARLPEPAPGVEPPQPVVQPEGLAVEATILKARQWMLGIQSGPLKGQRIPLGECLKIGRAGENDLVLADTQVSRKHAIIEKAGVGYQVTDLRSGNGTLVNEALITQPTGLKHGDVVQIGETRMTILSPAGTAPLPLEESAQAEAAVGVQPAIRRCPHCGATLKPAARFCGTCGKPVLAEEVAPQATTPAAPAAAPARVCPKCGEPARPGVNFCKKCGTKL